MSVHREGVVETKQGGSKFENHNKRPEKEANLFSPWPWASEVLEDTHFFELPISHGLLWEPYSTNKRTLSCFIDIEFASCRFMKEALHWRTEARSR